MTHLRPWAGRGQFGPPVASGPSVARLAPFLIQTLKGNDPFESLGRDNHTSTYPHIHISIYPYILISLYPYILIFLYPYILISLYPYILISLYPYILIPLHPYIPISLYSHIHISTYPYMLISIYPHIHISIYAYINISVYPYSYISTLFDAGFLLWVSYIKPLLSTLKHIFGPSLGFRRQPRLAPFLIQTLRGTYQFKALSQERQIRASRGLRTLCGPFGSVFNTNFKRKSPIWRPEPGQANSGLPWPQESPWPVWLRF